MLVISTSVPLVSLTITAQVQYVSSQGTGFGSNSTFILAGSDLVGVCSVDPDSAVVCSRGSDPVEFGSIVSTVPEHPNNEKLAIKIAANMLNTNNLFI